MSVLEILGKLDVIYPKGHYVHHNGRHGETYYNKFPGDAICSSPLTTKCLCEGLVEHFADFHVEAVVAPLTDGGAILSHVIAYGLRVHGQGRDKEILSLYVERDANGSVSLMHGYRSLVTGKRILVVADAIDKTDARTMAGFMDVRDVVNCVRQAGGRIVGVGTICNFGPVPTNIFVRIPLCSLVTIDTTTYAQEECPMCKEGVPINLEIGYGKVFSAAPQKG
jgi:orotate phosphoribosyltransferase